MRRASVKLVMSVMLAGCHQSSEPSAPLAANTTAQRAKTPTSVQVLQDGALAQVAERTVPSVVNVYASAKPPKRETEENALKDPFFQWFFGQPPGGGPGPGAEAPEPRSLGSGVIVSADGTILTNNHVVENAKEVQVTLSDGRELGAKLVGSDPQTDLAVLKLDEKVEGLRALPFGDSSAARLGEVVLAVGNPFGVGQTVTMGIISATGRSSVGLADYEDYIQTDAAINPGNSGGALVDMEGKLIGINTAIASRSGGYQGVGFAIPSDMAQPIVKSLLEHGRVVRGYLGVSIQDVTAPLAEAFKLEEQRGALVGDVVEGTPGAKAGLKAGDVIVRIDGQEVKTSTELRNIVASRAPGTKVELGLVRNGERRELEVTLGELPSSARVAEGAEGQGGPEVAGLAVTGLDAQTRARFEIAADIEHGVVVAQVQPGGPAAHAGLRPGDVILAVDQKAVKSPQQFRERFQAAGEQVLLHLARGEGRLFVVLSKPK